MSYVMQLATANLRTKILDLRGFDSSIIVSLRGGILMPIGDFLEILSQGILVGIIHLSREIGRARQALRPRPKQLDWREEYTNIYIYIYT